MFDFIIKRSEIVLDCFTKDYNTFEYFKITKSSNFIPKWWKKLPSSITIPSPSVGEIPSPTMKGCAGFSNFFNEGFILPLWSDLILKTDTEKVNFHFSSENCSASDHHPSQTNNTFNFFHHIKLHSPWFLKCNKNVNFYWAPAFWSFVNKEDFIKNLWIMPGIVDFNINNFTNVNIFLNKKENNFLINAGFPLVHIIPLSDKKVILKNHLLDHNKNITSGLNPVFTMMHKKLSFFKKQQNNLE